MKKKLVQVSRISTKQKAALEDAGYDILIADSRERQLNTLHKTAAGALKRGNVAQAKSIRLNMLRLIKSNQDDV